MKRHHKDRNNSTQVRMGHQTLYLMQQVGFYVVTFPSYVIYLVSLCGYSTSWDTQSCTCKDEKLSILVSLGARVPSCTVLPELKVVFFGLVEQKITSQLIRLMWFAVALLLVYIDFAIPVWHAECTWVLFDTEKFPITKSIEQDHSGLGVEIWKKVKL